MPLRGEKVEDKQVILTKAALLHDIGKVCFRAGEGKKEHSFLGAEFLKRFLDKEYPSEAFLRCIKYHHASNLKNANIEKNDLSYLVYEADNISSGSDRRKNENEESGFLKKAALESVFNVLGKISSGKGKFLLKDMAVDGKINYPLYGKNVETSSSEYSRILTVIENNFSRVSVSNSTSNEILKILEATMSFVPSSTAVGEVCDISLYDHQKLTAAIADVMYQYFQKNNVKDYQEFCFGRKNSEFRATETFLLISGDLSGIQKFIYTIPSDGALKNLRGRSVYLELFIENIVDEILNGLQLSRANLIYTGGGHFYILAANTSNTINLLEDSKEKITDWLLKKYGTKLYMELVWTTCSANELMAQQGSNGISDVFFRLSQKMSQGKLSRYSTEQLQQLFNPESDFNKTKTGERECFICHSSTQALESYALHEDRVVCHNCNSLYSFGNDILVANAALVLTRDCAKQAMELPCLGGNLFMQSVLLNNLESFATKHEIERIYAKNDYLIGNNLSTHIWLGDYAARDSQGRVLDFATLASLSGGENETGINRLGVLRADVDNLGATFLAGFYKEEFADHSRYATLSRFAVLSRELSLFFKNYVNKLCAGSLNGYDEEKTKQFTLFGKEKERERHVNIVYSGGDDIFMVGAWDDIIEFAVDLEQSFMRFTGGKLHFSAGIGLFRPGYPVGQMARLTGILEEKAKSMDGKDSIALFGENNIYDENGVKVCNQHTYQWKTFIDKVCREKVGFLTKYLDLMGSGEAGKLTAGKGVLYRLLGLLSEEVGQEFNLARFAYTIARMEPGPKAGEIVRENYIVWKTQMYKWAKHKEERRELVTALNLIIYKLRETEKGA